MDLIWRVEWASRIQLQVLISQWISEGWTVGYTIPQMPPQPYNPNAYITSSSPCSSVYTNPDGSTQVSFSIPGRSPAPIQQDFHTFEVGLYRTPPCPRCSYPNPDDSRIDREI